MNKIWRILIVSLLIIFLAIFNIGLSYILPFPYDKVNIILASVILILLWTDSGLVIWVAFFSHLFIELFTTTPFGIILFAGTISTLTGFWLYKHIFTNRSLIATSALTIFILFIYRLIFILLLKLVSIFFNITIIPWQQILITFFWELIFTTLLVGCVYFILSFFSQKFKVSNIKKDFFRI